MAKKKTEVQEVEAIQETTQDATRAREQATADLAAALTQAINATKPIQKKTVADRKKRAPWTPPEGVARVKAKRAFFQHGIPICVPGNDPRLFNEEIELLNQIKPGYYCEGVVKVTLRRDRGIDIDYPIKTASQRLRLVNSFGVTNLASLLRRIIDEKKNPKAYRRNEDLDLFDDDNS